MPDFGEYSDDVDSDGDGFEAATALMEGDELDEGDAGRGEQFDDGSVTPAQLLAASKVIDLWIEEEEDEDTQRSERAAVTAQLLGRALRVFTRAQDGSALEHVASMLVYEPSLTPTIARYLRACGESARGRARDTLDDVCRSGIVSTWQAVWISYVAGEITRRRGGDRLAHVAWLKAQLGSRQPILRAEAMLALARRRLTTADDILDVAAGLPKLHRPTALLALAALGDADAAVGLAESELDRFRIEWALQRL